MGLFSDTGALFGRYLTKLVRNPVLLLTNLVTPVLFFALFSQMLGKIGVFPGVGPSFASYLAPGILVMCSMMFAAQAGVSIVNDLNSGFLPKILVTPVRRSAILLGRLLTDALSVFLSAALVILAALLLGVVIVTGAPGILLLLVTSALFGLVWSGLFLALGIRTRSPEVVSSMASGVIFLLLFISTAVFPASILPGWAQTFSDWNPVSYVATALRSAVQGGFDWRAFAEAYAIMGGLALVAFSAAVDQFRRVIR